jgi:hypothetical protein
VYASWKALVEKEKLEEMEQQKKNQEKAHGYHQALHNQLLETEEKKRLDYEAFLKEKEMIDEVVAKIMLENEREAKERMEKREETKQFIGQFMKERELWKKQEKLRQLAENKKIAEYAELQKQREDEMLFKKKALAAGKDAIYDKVTVILYSLRLKLSKKSVLNLNLKIFVSTLLKKNKSP